jgi:magnesium transporter
METQVNQLIRVEDATKMNSNHIFIPHHFTTTEARSHVQNAIKDPSTLFYLYVLDNNILVGTVSPHKLLAAKNPNLDSILNRDIIVARPSELLTDAKRKMIDAKLLALPVIDATGQLQGVIEAEDITGIKPTFNPKERNSLIFKMMGLSDTILSNPSFFRLCVMRSLGILLFNVLGGSACALILNASGADLQRLLALTLFMPVLLTICEAIAAQAVVLSLASKDEGQQAKKAIKEFCAGATIGALTGIVALLIAFCLKPWLGNAGIDHTFATIFLGCTIAAGAMASIIGLFAPKVFSYLQLETKYAPSNPAALAVTDITTLLIYILLIYSIL